MLRSFKRLNLPWYDIDLAVVLDADLPVGRPGDPAEAAPVNDEPLVGSGGTGALDLLRARPLRLDHPVDIFGPESLGVVDVELAPLDALGLFPVDFLAAGLDDVQVEVDAVGVPDQGELRVADLDGDAADQLAPLAESGQAKAVAIAGPGVIVGLAAPAAGVLGSPKLDFGLERSELELSQATANRRRARCRRAERPASAAGYSVRR